MQQKELARILGVSTATISMALRGKGRISPNIREKILAVAFKHRVGVRRMRQPDAEPPPKTPTLRIAYCGLGEQRGWFHSGTFRGLSAPVGVARHEILLQVGETPYGADRAAAAQRIKASVLAMENLDALVIDPSRWLVDALLDVPLPKVMVGYFNHAPGRIDAVVPDNTDGAYRLTRRLIESGARRIACVQCIAGDWNSREKLAGYKLALEHAGLEFDPRLVFDGNFSLHCGARLARKLVELPEPADAVFVGNDWLSGSFVRELKDIDRETGASWSRLPLAHFGDSMLDPEVCFAHDRVELATDVMGRQAIRLLLDRISGLGPEEPVTVKVQATFRAGGVFTPEHH
ncbi:MAG: LacI family transcriptional regulator [Planctomycetota bacterium]|nr:LacI family transcriptional regulator [Planctomycetota bacterium]